MKLRNFYLIAGYIGLTLLLVAVTAALVAYGNDYAYDLKAHQIVQRGHVIINSVPGNIKLTEDGKETRKKTPYQAAYSVGRHTFSLVRDGFWPWQKALEVVAGQVTMVRYAILVPKNPTKTVLDTRTQIKMQSMSKDHRHLAYVTGGPDMAVYTLDIGGLGTPKPNRLYAAKPPLAPMGAEVLIDVTWSDDASHLLIHSQVDGKDVYRLAAASGGEPVNLTDKYKLDFAGLRFSTSNWKQLYWISPEGLRKLDVDNGVSAVLADRVKQFWVTQDRVLYVRHLETGNSLWSIDSHGRMQELIQALVVSDSYVLAYAKYRGEDELAIIPLTTKTATLYTGIFGDTPVAKTLAHDVTAVSFSPDGFFLTMTSPTTVATYDLERSSVDEKTVMYEAPVETEAATAMTWFDTYHLLSNRGGRLYWSEFDGQNKVDLGLSSNGFAAYNTADEKGVIMVRPGGRGMEIVQVQIKQ